MPCNRVVCVYCHGTLCMLDNIAPIFRHHTNRHRFPSSGIHEVAVSPTVKRVNFMDDLLVQTKHGHMECEMFRVPLLRVRVWWSCNVVSLIVWTIRTSAGIHASFFSICFETIFDFHHRLVSVATEEIYYRWVHFFSTQKTNFLISYLEAVFIPGFCFIFTSDNFVSPQL